MPLLYEIQEAAVDSKKSLSDALRRCIVLGSILRNDALLQWANAELSGYSNTDDLPHYRKLENLHVRGSFVGPFKQLPNQNISTAKLSEEWSYPLTTYFVRESVAAIEGMVSSDGLEVYHPIPTSVLQLFNDIYYDMECYRANKVIGIHMFLGVLDCIRQKMLTMVLELSNIPEAKDLEFGSTPSEKVIQAGNTAINYSISGGNNQLIVGHNISGSSVNVSPGNLDELLNSLAKLKISYTELRDLERALEEEPQANTDGKLGPKVTAWIKGVCTGAATAVGESVGESGTKAVLDALSQFYDTAIKDVDLFK